MAGKVDLPHLRQKNLGWTKELDAGTVASVSHPLEKTRQKLMLLAFLIVWGGCVSKMFGLENPPAFLWAKQLGGSESNTGESIAVDKTGNVYVTGRMDYESGQFIGTHGWYHKGGKVFLAKYDATGNLLWLQKFGGGSDNHASGVGIAIDPQGDVYVTGTFSGAIKFDQTKFTSAGQLDSFLAKFEPDGKLIWVKQAGGKNSFCESYGLAVDGKGYAYITGNFVGKTTFGSDNMISRSGIEPGRESDMFLVKYDPSGNMVWMRQAGEMGENTGHGIAVDRDDNIYVTGRFAQGCWVKISISFENIKIAEILNVKNTDTNEPGLFNFIAKYNSAGKVIWAKPTAGLAEYGTENSIAVSKTGQIYVAGSFNFSCKVDGIPLTNRVDGNDDIFLVKYDADGKTLWARSAGGKGHDECYGVTTDNAGEVYILGDFMDEADFGKIIVHAKPHHPDLGPSSPTMVAKYDPTGEAVWVKMVDKADGNYERAGMSTGIGIAAAASNDIYITGDFGGIYAPIVFDSIQLKSASNLFGSKGVDIFVAKLGNKEN